MSKGVKTLVIWRFLELFWRYFGVILELFWRNLF